MSKFIHIIHFYPAGNNDEKMEKKFLMVYNAGVFRPFFFMKMNQ